MIGAQLFAGFLYDDSGAAVVGATCNLYDRNTTTPVRATTTTDSNGYWAISHATEGRFDVEIVNGSSKRRIKYDDSVQLETVEVAVLRQRNPADTFDLTLVTPAITADRDLNWPLITAEDTLASLGLAQTFSAVKTFSAIPEMTGGAIGFPATQVASADVNDLDDYEEGAWTPNVGGTATYTTQQGRYIKVGRLVFVTGNIEINVLGTGSATTLSGFPFTKVNTEPGDSLHVGYFGGLAANTIFLAGFVSSNAATAAFYAIAASGAAMSQISLFGNAARVQFAAVYEATG